MRNSYKHFFLKTLKGKKHLGDLLMERDNIKTDVKEIEYGTVK
jgi:hypothetical protein